MRDASAVPRTLTLLSPEGASAFGFLLPRDPRVDDRWEIGESEHGNPDTRDIQG
jgi:hypothetical protein